VLSEITPEITGLELEGRNILSPDMNWHITTQHVFLQINVQTLHLVVVSSYVQL